MEDYTVRIQKIVEENYDVTILKVFKIKNVYKIIAVEGDFCLKQVNYEFYRFNHIIEIFKHLEKKEFDNIIKIIRTYDGMDYIENENIFYYLTKWVNSRALNYSNTYDIILGSQNIANFHKHSRGFSPSDESHVDIRWMKWIKIFKSKMLDIKKFEKIISMKNKLTTFDKIYLKNIRDNLVFSEECIENLEKFNYFEVMDKHMKSKFICHHDLANHNMLMDSRGKIYFIDFDYVILDSYLHDLASFIMRNLKIGRWNEQKFSLILNSYKDVLRVSRKEVCIMLSFLLFPNDYWQIGLQYYVENIRWSEEQFLRRLTRFENDKSNRNDFLKRIISKNS